MSTKYIKVTEGIHLKAAIDAFIFRGFMDMSIEWKTNNSPVYGLKPVYQRVKKLSHTDWNNQLKLPSNGDGIFRFQGFQSDYILRYLLINMGLPESGRHFSPYRFQAGRIAIQTYLLWKNQLFTGSFYCSQSAF